MTARRVPGPSNSAAAVIAAILGAAATAARDIRDGFERATSTDGLTAAERGRVPSGLAGHVRETADTSRDPSRTGRVGEAVTADSDRIGRIMAAMAAGAPWWLALEAEASVAMSRDDDTQTWSIPDDEEPKP